MLDPGQLDRLRDRQSGVVARWQVETVLGGDAHDFRRLARGGRVLWRGVCVDHTGVPTWSQRAWAAVLTVGPAEGTAALAGASALRAEAGPGWRDHDETAPIEVAVDARRTVLAPAGIRVRRVVGLDQRVRWNAGPPRMRFEEAVLDVVLTKATVVDIVEALAAGVRARCTTATRLVEALDARSRFRGRQLVRGLLLDLRDGTCSALEHGYLSLVERPHDLPVPERQFHERPGGRSVYRDAEHVAMATTVELDGDMFHARNRRRAVDLDRDLDLAAEGRLGVRLGWAQVYDHPCRTAGKVARILQLRGWTGRPVSCGPGCVAPGVAAA